LKGADALAQPGDNGFTVRKSGLEEGSKIKKGLAIKKEKPINKEIKKQPQKPKKGCRSLHIEPAPTTKLGVVSQAENRWSKLFLGGQRKKVTFAASKEGGSWGGRKKESGGESRADGVGVLESSVIRTAELGEM